MRRDMMRAVVGSVFAAAAYLMFPATAPAQAMQQAGPVVSLEEAVRTSVSQNRELAAARMELVGAGALVREAWSAVYPTVNASANYTRNLEVPGQFLPARFFDPNADENEQVLVRFGADNVWQGSLRLEQPLFQAAAFIGVGAAARFNALQQEVVRGKTQEIVTRTRQSYYDVLLAREGTRLNAESVRRVRQTLEETRSMNRAGLVGDYDVLRLEVELANLEPALRRSENQLLASRRALAVALALDGTEMVEVEGSLSSLSLVEEASAAAPDDAALLAGFGVRDPEAADERELIAAARANRSDLRQIRLMESLRTAELRAEQSEYLPRLALFATYAYQGQGDGAINPFAFGDARSTTIPQVGLQLTVPVFSGFARPARVQQRRATVLQLNTQAREAEAQIANQVRTLLDQVREARERADAQAHARRQAQRGYEIASVQYREGLGSRLEVTDAEVALRQSEFNYAQAIYDYLTARARLDEAVGAVTVRF